MESPGMLDFMSVKVEDIFLIQKNNPIFTTRFTYKKNT